MIFHPDGRLIAAAGTKVYVLRTNKKPQFELGRPRVKALVNDVAVTRDGRRIFAAMSNGTVQVWDAHTGEAVSLFRWRIGGIFSLALAPDGLTCAATGSRSRVVLWDIDA